ncbi:MAG: hypothetical protein KatS3mg077_3195 [Candidatus Binatia bacterium]|nr:MAG: hypothetical protein KatS3mg077_3195 [Candidatus Binatia bacterium]
MQGTALMSDIASTKEFTCGAIGFRGIGTQPCGSGVW